MLKFTLYYFLFFYTIVSAQNMYNVELPENNLKTSKVLDDIISPLKIVINRENKVFVEGKKIDYFSEIFVSVLDLFNDQESSTSAFNVVLIADKLAELPVVYECLEQISRFSVPYIYLKMDSNNSSYYEIAFLNGSTKDELMDDNIEAKTSNFREIQITPLNIEISENGLAEKSTYELLIDFRRDLYNLDLVKVKNVMSNYKYLNLTLKPNGKIFIGGVIYNFEKLESLLKLYAEGYILLVHFDKNLKYLDYVQYIQGLNIFRQGIQFNPENRGQIMEISYGLEKKLESVGFNIFNN